MSKVQRIWQFWLSEIHQSSNFVLSKLENTEIVYLSILRKIRLLILYIFEKNVCFLFQSPIHMQKEVFVK